MSSINPINKNSHPTNAVIEKNKDGKRNYKQD